MRIETIKVLIDSHPNDSTQIHINWELPTNVVPVFIQALFDAKRQAEIQRDPNPCFRCDNGAQLNAKRRICPNCRRENPDLVGSGETTKEE